MIRSKIAMAAWWTLLLLALHVWPGAVGRVHAQGTRKDDIVFNSRGVPLAGAAVRICAMPATGQPCTPLALIYSDAALTQAIANPTTTDGMGNYFFYAAPGRYEVEISGPGITSKQLPNVLLPSDPTSPTFTGAVSAFSLNLSGNLTVNGNTTVVGSLASGTLNLTNQGSPPGSASAGTINLYTKTADKRLYYKDDTGTEIGPIAGGGGIQTNITNTFTVAQNFDANAAFKGPNPYYDLTRYGLYAGVGGPPLCSTTATSTTVTCNNISDFLVGQGIAIPTAGVASNLVWGVAGITAYSRSSNVATLTYSGPTFGAGQTITVTGLADATFNGNFTVAVNDGDFGHITMANVGSNLGTTAGSGTATLTSGQVAVTPQGIVNGATTYAYKVALRGFNGELSAASTAGSTTAGAAALGVNTITLSGCTRSGGVVTCTSAAPHNIQGAGILTDVEGVSDGSFSGEHMILATPTSTTFTFTQSSVGDATGATGGTAKVVAKNLVQWNMQEYLNMQAIVYRSINGGAYSVAGVVEGMDGAFVDWGLGAPVKPPGVPATPPASPVNGVLSTTITAINGTTLTIANAATATATNVSTPHDNVPAVLAACAALGSSGVGTLYIPATNPPTNVPFNSPLDFYHNCNVRQIILAVGSTLVVNDPFISLRAGLTIKGVSPSGLVPSFGIGYSTQVIGNAYPFVLYMPGSFGPSMLENLSFYPNQAYQSAFVEDADAGGGAVVNTQYTNVSAQGNGGSMPGIIRGGFNKFFEKGSFSSNGAWGVPESLEITESNSIGICASCSTLAYILKFDRVQFSGHGIEWDDWGLRNTNVSGYMSVSDTLMESGYGPLMTVNLFGGNTMTGIEFNRAQWADFLIGGSTPMFLTGASSVGGFVSNFSSCGTGIQPLFEGSLGGVQVTQGTSDACNLFGAASGVITGLNGPVQSSRQYINIPVQASGTSEFYFAMGTPAVPTAVVSSGGNVPVGVHTYQIAALDGNGNPTYASPPVSVTTTTGNQTVTVTPVLPAGAIGFWPYRDGVKADDHGNPCNFYVPGAGPFVDIMGFACGQSQPAVSTAATVALNSSGLLASQLEIVGGGFPGYVTGNFTAARSQTMADVSGIIPVTGYQNTAYDNFKRANGAIGSNWTVGNGGFNVASNAVVGTASGTNLAAYTGATFSASQFAQVTVATLNGASDYVGVDVLLSSANNGYSCLENNAILLIQKVTAAVGATLTSSATAGAVGDVLRLEVAPGGVLTCSRTNGSTTTSITATDTTFTAGSPALEQFGNVATLDNWSGGNLHPLGHLDLEQDFAKVQHFGAGLTVGAPTNAALNRYAKYTATLSPAIVAANTCAEQTFTVTGLQAADIAVNGDPKPTHQAGLGETWIVSAPNTAAVNFCNTTAAGITPTASQVYSFIVMQ